ncbi:hypothetical protein [Gemmata sp.]|uniref:hypothetical protein n=1 Tax=Gemmata sp. TaxID=1914242 RepID=UPI003F6F2514
MRQPGTAIPLILSALLLSAAGARADGGTVRVSEPRGRWQVTVFTSPTPLRAGPIDVSVLVQDARTTRPDPSVRVTVTATSRTTPPVVVTEPATAEAATNKLLVAAVFDLPEGGWWDFRVEVSGVGETHAVTFEAEAAEPLPEWLALAAWVAWPAAAVLVFAAHQLLVRRKAGSK